MGNTPPSGTSFRLGNGDNSVEVRRGSGFVQAMGKSNGEITEEWDVSYWIGLSGCGSFVLTKTKGNTKSPHHHGEKLEIKIEDLGLEVYSDNSNSSVIVEKAETGILGLSFRHFFNHASGVTYFPMPTTSTANAQGGITETIFNFYCRKNGRWRVLIVCELKKKSKDENPYMVTVSHYVAYIGNNKDVGFSVAVKRIRVSDDGHLDFAVDGPHQHPATALFYMFDQVRRTRTWPICCPHCANSIIRRQPSMSSHSESEDSDKDNVPTARLHGRQQNAGGILANDGVIMGNNNGNLNVKNLIFRGS